ncbi:hypothetical protein DF182_06030 [Chitinophaga flava]|uniref:Uncharacterized protein n=1 Tax=Chitinophaga flava TaxID=2259036 RepID=A0A365Y0M4_9BACT|nr:hypothetical protein DF182_06030 [Chitinophaga flava]
MTADTLYTNKPLFIFHQPRKRKYNHYKIFIYLYFNILMPFSITSYDHLNCSHHLLSDRTFLQN